MPFDITEYTKAMEHFLLAMQQVMKPGDPKMATAVKPLCKVLRISKVYIDFYQNQEYLQQKVNNCIVIGIFYPATCVGLRYGPAWSGV